MIQFSITKQCMQKLFSKTLTHSREKGTTPTTLAILKPWPPQPPEKIEAEQWIVWKKVVLNYNFQKQKLFVKTICKVWKKNHPVCLQEIVRKDKSYNLQKGCPEEWFTKLQNLAATKIFKWLIRNDPFRDFLIMLFDINSLHLPFPKLVCIKFWINHI